MTVPAGTINGNALNISCNAGFRLKQKNITCQDGTFKTDDDVAVDNHTVFCTKDCDGFVIVNGTTEVTAATNGTTIDTVCDDTLSSYYANTTCINGYFRPSRVVCANYPREEELNGFPLVRYQGQFFVAVYNPSKRWDQARDVCAGIGGILATALSADLLSNIKSTMPNPVDANGLYLPIGLQQKSDQSAADLGWQWVDSATGSTIEIDSGKTISPNWISPHPDDGKEIDIVEDNSQNCGAISQYANLLGVVDTSVVSLLEEMLLLCLCQIEYPFYEFAPVHVGGRIEFPHESTVVAANLEICTSSCIHSAFCRAVSYAPSLTQCNHHSVPPSDSEAVIVTDVAYTIYA